MANSSRPSIPITVAGTIVALVLAAPWPAGASPAETDSATARCDWKLVSTPDLGPDPSALGAADALDDDDVWAVGSVGGFAHEKTVVEHFDGTAWSRMKTPNPRQLSTDGNVLNGVDALAPDDVWAVGTHFINGQTDSRPLILHWTGAKWRAVPNPPGQLSSGFLRGVVAVSADDVWAVGARFNGGPGERDPLILHWDGSAWSIADAANPAGFEADTLAAVTAVSANDVWAVGRANEAKTLTEHWDGQRWTIVPSPNPGGGDILSGVVAFSPNDVWAVGSSSSTYGSITLHWDGAAWRVVPNEHQAQFDNLAAVAARSLSDVWAVGSNQTLDQDHFTFAEHFDGSRWRLSNPVSPGSYDALFGVAASSQAVWAVGSSATDSFAVPHAIVERHC